MRKLRRGKGRDGAERRAVVSERRGGKHRVRPQLYSGRYEELTCSTHLEAPGARRTGHGPQQGEGGRRGAAAAALCELHRGSWSHHNPHIHFPASEWRPCSPYIVSVHGNAYDRSTASLRDNTYTLCVRTLFVRGNNTSNGIGHHRNPDSLYRIYTIGFHDNNTYFPNACLHGDVTICTDAGCIRPQICGHWGAKDRNV
ncbi:unnamed protein product [Gadus morhua 'NCC']